MTYVSKTVNPTAAVVIWNYKDRLVNSEVATDVDEVEAPVLLTAGAVASIRTSKTKSSPVGNFELMLAPNRNWLSKITAGSWIAIVMTQTPLSQIQITQGPPPQAVKMLGRVDSVRAVVTVDQESGARKTSYVVTGRDWGSVFESILYLDPIARDFQDAPVGGSMRALYDDLLLKSMEDKKGLPTSTTNTRLILQVWGKAAEAFAAADLPPTLFPESMPTIPLRVATYMKLFTPGALLSNKIGDLITLVSGKLSGEDSYEDVDDSIGIVRPDSIFGGHTVWQVLMDNCNDILNELVCDLRYDGQKCYLALYKRIKPFAVNSPSFVSINPSDTDLMKVQNLVSKYADLRSTQIPLEDILTINAGTNWRDKVNFAEVLYDPSLADDNRNSFIKIDSSITDRKSYARDGFKPMILSSKYLPGGDDALTDPLAITKWKYLLKEWYFNTHNMLNGAITFIGQDNYIQVGDNIMIPAKALTPTRNINAADNSMGLLQQDTFILAHVESVSHEFKVNEEGARSYFTTVQFVRGIITNENKQMFFPGMNVAMDSQADAMSWNTLKNKNTTAVPSIKKQVVVKDEG